MDDLISSHERLAALSSDQGIIDEVRLEVKIDEASVGRVGTDCRLVRSPFLDLLRFSFLLRESAKLY